jgi:hypothetical protein
MILMPVRVAERREDGVLCRLGSEPGPDAEVVFLPSDCIINMAVAEGSDLGVVTIDLERAPDGVRRALGSG